MGAVGATLSEGCPDRLVHDSDIVEFELKSKRFSLSVRKKEALQAEQAAALQVRYRAAPRVQRLCVPALGGCGGSEPH